MSLAVVVIASAKRMNTTFPLVMQSVLDEKPDEIVCVADFHCAGNWRHLMIPAFTKTTIDALIKRDVGWVATKSDNVMFLSDDHVLTPGFMEAYKQEKQEAWKDERFWDIIVPTRWARKDEQNAKLNMGRETQYCAGHGGIFRRGCGNILPWTACILHPNWDVIHTHHLIANGCEIIYSDKLMIEDIEGGQPWL